VSIPSVWQISDAGSGHSQSKKLQVSPSLS